MFFAGVLAIILLWSFLMRPIFLDQSEAMMAYVYLLAAPCAWLFECSFRSSQSVRLRAVRVIVFVSIATSVVLHVNYLFVPNLSIFHAGEGIAQFKLDTSTTRSMLLNPSMHGSIVVLGMIALLACLRTRLNILGSHSAAVVFILLMFSSLFYGQSRTPLVFGGIVLVAFVYCSMSWRALAVLSVGFAMTIPLFDQQAHSFVQYIGHFLARGDLLELGGRDIKFQLSLMLLFDSFPSLLIGLPSSVLESASLSGYQVSDNSFFLVAFGFGVPVSFCYYACNFAIAGYRSFLSLSSVLLASLVLTNLSLTNSILWQPFITGAIVLFGSLPAPRSNVASPTCH